MKTLQFYRNSGIMLSSLIALTAFHHFTPESTPTFIQIGNQRKPNPPKVSVERMNQVRVVNHPTQPSELLLQDGTHWQTPLYQVSLVGRLETSEKRIYFILAGFDCTECCTDRGVYVFESVDGRLKLIEKSPVLSFPGTIRNYESGKIFFQSRLFWGQCLEDKQPSIVYVMAEKNEQGRWKKSILVVDFQTHNPKETTLPHLAKTVAHLEARKAQGLCFELPGKAQISSP